MKKILWALGLSAFTLASCSLTPATSGTEGGDQTATPSTNQSAFKEGSKVLFSEFYLGTSVSTRAVEISNYGDSEIELSDYEIRIYRGNTADKADRIIPLPAGKLAAGKAYVIAYKGNAETVKADFLTPDLVCDGSWPLGLYQKGVLVDTLGQIGVGNNFAGGSVLVRKNERRVGRDRFAPYDWVTYHGGDSSHLGDANCPVTQERLSQGPKLTEAEFSAPYVLEGGKIGGGGVLEVTVTEFGDGDTTYFKYPKVLNDLGFAGNRMRYQNIDTPETQHGDKIQAQPWGYAAKDWNNAKLKGAKHILIQSVRDGYITETYGRLLGYVWYTNVENPTPADYTNLNFETILNGYSKVAFSSVASDKMISDGVSYYSYFLDADAGAAEAGIKVHGERDPNFQY